MKKEQRIQILDRLKETYPDAACALHYANLYQLLVAVVLSAQTTDVSVNKVTPALFQAYPDPASLAEADPNEVASLIRTLGMYKTKSNHLVAMAQKLVTDFGGKIPAEQAALETLPGVGRKTANVILSVGFGEQRIAVDTHVFRVSNRIGLVRETKVDATELALMKNLPKDRWTEAHHSLIFHGRNCCKARKPACTTCPIEPLCEKHL